jgi:tetratricopeptide (TPR) repeat protein
MFRRLTAFARWFAAAPRAAVHTFRAWLHDWFYLLFVAPLRWLRPRYWIGLLGHGMMELLLLLRPVKDRQFGPQLVGEGRKAWGESFHLIREIVRGTIGTAVAFFWFLLLLPGFLLHHLYHGPIWAWHFLRTRTRRQLVVVLAVAVIALGAVGGVPAYLLHEHRRTTRLNFLHRKYEGYLTQSTDLNNLQESLEGLHEALPEDNAVARRLEMVRQRQAPASEPDLVRFFMRQHMGAGRIDESVREANKLLESYPNDWDARVYLAWAALYRGNKDAAKQELARLPSTKDSAARIYGDVALASARLFAELGDQAHYDEIVEFVTVSFLPDLQDVAAVYLPIPQKLFLIRCYYLALTRLDRRPWLTRYWTPLERACQSIVDDQTVDATTLAVVGGYGQHENLKCLELFRSQRLISEDELGTMLRDLTSRQGKLWDRVLKMDPKLPAGYIGAAEYFYLAKNPVMAEQAIGQGLRECGPLPELVLQAGKLYRLIDPQRGLEFLERTVKDDQMTPVMCQVFDDVAAAAGRPDKAIEVCRRALKANANQDWARLREAGHCLKLGRPAEAVAALKPIEDRLVRYPAGCADYVRALAETGRDQQADDFLARVGKADCPAEVLLQAAEGLQAAGRNAEAVRWAEQVLARDNRNVEAWMIKADNSRIQADRGPDGWDVDLAREAVDAYQAALRLDADGPTSDRAANNVAWLQLKALRLPADAFESTRRLRAIEDRVDTKAEYLETLGAVYLSVHEYDKAVKMLRQAVATSGARASFYTYLALAYHGLREHEKAEHFLKRAGECPLSPRDLVDLRAAERAIHTQ